MRKIRNIGCLLLLAALTLTGCAGNANTLSSPTPGANSMAPAASPGVQSSPMLSTTNMPILSDIQDGLNAMGGLTAINDVKRASEEMQDAVEQLSEVNDAYVVAYEDTALVGLEMDSQYQGQVDERLQKMVLGRVQTIEKGVTKVAVTADEQKVKEIEALADRLDNAENMTEINAAMQTLMDGITLYQE